MPSKSLQDGVGFPVCCYQSETHPSALRDGLRQGHLPPPEMMVWPHETWACEFHGSAWNPKPGPDRSTVIITPLLTHPASINTLYSIDNI